MIVRHRVAAREFALLASGQGDAGTTRTLWAGQRSRRALLVRAVLDAATHWPREAAAAGLADAVRLLDVVQRKAPDEASAVLDYPLVGTWAAQCLRSLRRPGTAEVPLWVDLGHLASIAAAAAVQARLDVEITVPVRAGLVSLPTLGQASLPTSAAWGVATLRGDSGAYVISGQHGSVPVHDDDAGWIGLHRLDSTRHGHRLTVYLDDLDPYRGGHGLAVTGRLDPATRDAWSSTLVDGWAELVDRHPARAAELAERPLTIVPLIDRGTGAGANATARDSVGAMALTPPPNAVALAQSIVHEFHHSKLGALLDLVDLYDVEDSRRFYSPWRGDPRPVSGLLQGVYAFLAVTEFWQAYVGVGDGPVSSRLAAYEFARGRAQADAAIATLASAGSLTDAGRRFVDGLRCRVESLFAVPVDPALVTMAGLVNDDHRLGWRLRNVRVAPDTVADLAERWRRGERPPLHRRDRPVVAATAPTYAEDPRHELIRLAATNRSVRGSAGDLALLDGDLGTAAAEFRAALAADWHQPDAWTGLALVRSRVGPARAGRTYSDEPEVLRALYIHLRSTGGTPDVDDLADWLAT
jgi:HEXXH motif-containing protein